MNITIDDTSPNFVWSTGAEDWRGQAPTQVALNSNYFLQTYHATQSKGSNVAITFVGAAIQIYGTKGPNHGNYSVTFDSTIRFFAGFSPQLQYQQLLFSRTFGSNFSETHTVLLKNEENYWLDLDFAVLSIATSADTATSDIGFFTNTVEPGTSVPPSPSNSAGASTTDASSSSSIFRTLTFALAGVLGVLIFTVALWYIFCIRRRRNAFGSASGSGGRDRALSNSSSQQEFRYAQKNNPLDTGKTLGSSAGGSDTYRNKFGKEDYARSPTNGSIATDPSKYSRGDTVGNVGGAARETLIALNNMGKRPGYRSLAGDGERGGGEGGSSTSVVHIGNDGRETPTSLRTMGSAGQVWLGATKGNTEENVRFKGRAGRQPNTRTSGYGSDSNLSNRALNRSRGTGLEGINDAKEEEGYASGMGLSMYASNMRSESDQQRMLDLKRSASVASSGILDRLQSSPPPAVPELPPSATTMSTFPRAPPPRSFSPTQTESTAHEHGGVYSGLGLATKIQFPYGRNNEMLVHSHSGSINSTSGMSANTTAGSLRPPPVRASVQSAQSSQAEERERERALLRERERAEKEREAEREKERRKQERYSRPPPEYVPTPSASEVSMPIPGHGHGLQRQGIRTGDIPIGIEGGVAYDEESQDSHSAAHAYVGTAQHVPLVSSTVYQQQQQQQDPLQQPPPRGQHVHMGSNGSSNLGLPNSTTTGTSSKRVVTPDRGRSYNPAGSMAVTSRANGRDSPAGAPAWASQTSEDKTWGLDGAHGADKLRSATNGLGRPILDDRARIAAAPPTAPTASSGIGASPRRVSRVPPPRV